MIIIIDTNLQPTLNSLALGDGITPELYVERKINAILLGQYKEILKKKIDEQKIEDIKTFETAITSIDAEIKVRDYVAPIEIIKPIEKATTTTKIIN